MTPDASGCPSPWDKLTDATMRAWTKPICERTGETHEEVTARFEREAAERRTERERDARLSAARDRVVEAAKAERVAYHSWVDSIGGESIDETMNRLDAWVEAESEMKKSVTALLALEAQEKEQADAEG